MNVSQSTAFSGEKISPSMVTPNLGSTPLRKREIERFIENLIIFQQKKNPGRWTYFTAEELAKSRGFLKLPQDEMEILEALTNGGRPLSCPSVSLPSGYMYKSGIYYHVGYSLIEVLKFYVKPVLN